MGSFLRRFSLALLLVAGLLSSAIPAHAVLYAPGETLDPACAPGDADCGVVSVVGTGIQGQVPYYAANGAVLTATSSITILQNGDVSIAGALAVGDAAGTRNNLGLSYATMSDLMSGMSIATWGDSLTAGAGGTPYSTQLASLSGYSVYNGGVGGESSTQIRVRMLADTAKHAWPTIIWAGRNNYGSPTQVKADIADMVAALGHENYIVLSIINQNVSNEYSGQSVYNAITQLNSDLEDIYGDHYLDVRSYLVSQYDSGISQDVIDHANDVPPSSLRSDNLHLNTAGYQKVAEYIYANIDLLQETGTRLLTTTNITTMLRNGFANPTVIGSSTPNIGYFTQIGIGTQSPLGKFQIQNDTNLTSSFTGTSTLHMRIVGTGGITGIDFGDRSLNSTTALARIGMVNGTGGTFLQFGTSASYTSGITNTALVISPGGNIGIGTTTPQQRLVIRGGDSVASTSTTPSGIFTILGTSGGINLNMGVNISPNYSWLQSRHPSLGPAYYALVLNPNGGNVGIGTTTPARALTVQGTVGLSPSLTASFGAGSLCLSSTSEVVYNSGTNDCLSSIRETKHNINSLAISELEMLQKLNPVSFIYNGDAEERLRYGFIADEADAIDSRLATRDAAGKLSGLDTSAFIALIVGAVQELSAKVTGFADSFASKRGTFETLCVGSTCITESELQEFLRESNQQPVQPTPIVPPPAQEEPAIPEEPAPVEPIVAEPRTPVVETPIVVEAATVL